MIFWGFWDIIFQMTIFLTTIFAYAWYINMISRLDADMEIYWIAVWGAIIILCGLYFSILELNEWSKP